MNPDIRTGRAITNKNNRGSKKAEIEVATFILFPIINDLYNSVYYQTHRVPRSS